MKHFKNIVYLLAVIIVSAAHAGSYEDFFGAVNTNDPATVGALLQRGFDVNARDPKGQTPLFLALQGGAFQVAEVLFRQSTLDVNTLNEAGESPLMIAALKGRTEWVQRLLDRGAQVNKSGWTPLHYAATGPQPATVTLLLDRGARIDARSPNGTTPLMMAAQYGNEASIDVLLARGADPRLRNERGLNAADFARLARRELLAAKLDRLAR